MGRRLGAQGRPHYRSFRTGHDRPRCVYVDFLNTGPAIEKTLRSVVNKIAGISRRAIFASSTLRKVTVK